MADKRRLRASEGTGIRSTSAVADLDHYLYDPPETRLLRLVREGMVVVDGNGEKIGKVEHVQMGDPEAVTVSPVVLQDRLGLREAFLDGAEPHVPEPFFSHLLRVGYAKIDGRGWIDTDYSVTPDMIQGVSDNIVSLKAVQDQIITEI